ncbi:MAG: IreB family regulatory phosphoprotein [Succiniclasticum sp.]|jgi:uncharacterized protein (UPF0297 family)|nr:IreB family regulatory phosphoprotein [Succiniclasticum sp.]MCI6223074.1 IreB family regulatory phosphoprotein [Selenomonadales bacterium]MDY2870341.1 IreB family regulatory phosphoprotein [Succiniclasticum sp.]MDY6302739.1 IreB family regulatory phosphoprotein [Succiniclasticum sp.]MDY6346305.1 IreB family regulatory phosphoprotein [Succiniclasticum sp.]
MSISEETMMFKRKRDKAPVAQTIREVCDALKARGYDPKDQLAGYLLSGDPTYITSFNDARNKIRQYERYELVEALLEHYLSTIRTES